ncbi:MAG: hypothetical protein IJC84_03240 [Clostridia bacterium]|nr:hypothetical protein [Clostridia bacterium]
MKKILSVFFAVMMLVSLFTVPASATEYILGFAKDTDSHNLEAYGLHTMNVFSTEIAPVIDGQVGNGEYPGPNNGCSLSAAVGDNLWMSAHSDGTEGFGSYYDISGYTAKEDEPAYVKSFLTYDNDFLYFAVNTVINEPTRTNWFIDTRCAFSQNSNIVASSSSNSVAWLRYHLYNDPTAPLRKVSVDVQTYGRQVALYNGSSFSIVSFYKDNYVDEEGVVWDDATMLKENNSKHTVKVLSSGRWDVTLEGRQPLGDILRITDVEYEDGAPLDYVPEWGAWGVAMQLESSKDVDFVLPNGDDYSLVEGELVFAQTMLPAYGIAYTNANSVIKGVMYNNTIQQALTTAFGRGANYLMNPVHFLGTYTPGFDYSTGVPTTPNEITYSTRVTRTIPNVLTSGIRGVNNRVVGLATNASGATGDNLTLTVVLAVVMLLCAAAAVVLFVMKKRSARNR